MKTNKRPSLMAKHFAISVIIAIMVTGGFLWSNYLVGIASSEAQSFYAATVVLDTICAPRSVCTTMKNPDLKPSLVASGGLSRADSWYRRISVVAVPPKNGAGGLLTTDQSVSYLACRAIVGSGADLTLGERLLVNGVVIDYEHKVVNPCWIFGGNTITLQEV